MPVSRKSPVNSTSDFIKDYFHGNTSTSDPVNEVGEVTPSGILLTPVPVHDSAESPWQPVEKQTANLVVLPSLALIAFIIAVCLRSCTWCKEDRRARRDISGSEDLGFEILTAGDRDFLEMEIRSDTTSMYDTVSSYASFLRRGNSYYYDSVNSCRGLGRHRDDSITSYRSLLLQQLDGKRDSVSSYRAFLQRLKKCKNESVQVELVSGATDGITHGKKSPRPRLSPSNGVLSRASLGTTASKGAKARPSGASGGTEQALDEATPPADGGPATDAQPPSHEDRGAASLRRDHRFKVSFVPDDQLNRGRSRPVVPSCPILDVVVCPPTPDFRVTQPEVPPGQLPARQRHNSLTAPLPAYLGLMDDAAAAGAREWQRGGSERRKVKTRPQSISSSKEAMLMLRRWAQSAGDVEDGAGNADLTGQPPSGARATFHSGSLERKSPRARSVDRKPQVRES